jgi:hypothetical protein
MSSFVSPARSVVAAVLQTALASHWIDRILTLATRAVAIIDVDVSRGHHLSVLNYVKIKTLPVRTAFVIQTCLFLLFYVFVDDDLCRFGSASPCRGQVRHAERFEGRARRCDREERRAQTHAAAHRSAARAARRLSDRVCASVEQVRANVEQRRVFFFCPYQSQIARATDCRRWTRWCSRSASISSWSSTRSSRSSPTSCCARSASPDLRRFCCSNLTSPLCLSVVADDYKTQDMLLQRRITLATCVKLSVLERIAFCTKTAILSSVGTCFCCCCFCAVEREWSAN